MTKCVIQTTDGSSYEFDISNDGPEIIEGPLPFLAITTAIGKVYFNPDHVVSVLCSKGEE